VFSASNSSMIYLQNKRGLSNMEKDKSIVHHNLAERLTVLAVITAAAIGTLSNKSPVTSKKFYSVFHLNFNLTLLHKPIWKGQTTASKQALHLINMYLEILAIPLRILLSVLQNMWVVTHITFVY
jgi:hypothetical protein